MFILRRHSLNKHRTQDSDFIYIDMNYPKRVIKIGLYFKNINKDRIVSIGQDKESITNMGFAAAVEYDSKATIKEHKKIISEIKKQPITQKLIIQRLFS